MISRILASNSKEETRGPMKWSLVLPEVAPEAASLQQLRLKGITANLCSGKIIVHGGNNSVSYSDIYFLDLAKKRWTKARPARGSEAPDVYRHTSNLVDDQLIVIGGYRTAAYSKSVYLFDLVTSHWHTVETKGIPLWNFAGHTCDYYAPESFLVIFGGRKDQTFFSQLLRVDLQTFKCAKIGAKGKGPIARTLHCSSIVGNGLYVFGGLSREGRMGDMYVLSLRGNRFLWSQPLMEGDRPPGVSVASLARNGSMLYLFGGYSGTVPALDILYSYDVAKGEWYNVPATGRVEPNTAHKAVHTGKEMIILGGNSISAYKYYSLK